MARVSEDHFTGHFSSHFHALSLLKILSFPVLRFNALSFCRTLRLPVYVSIRVGRRKSSHDSLWFISGVPSSTFLHFICYLVHLGIIAGAVTCEGHGADLHPDIKLTTLWREFISNVVQVSK